MQDLEDALLAVGQLQMRFGPRGEDAAREVELLWSLGRADDALAAARRAAPMMTDDAVSFWRLYGDLAWNLEADERRGLTSYLRLWTLDQRDASVADRLVTLLGRRSARRRGDPHRRRGVHRRFASPALLVAALDAATDAERWDDVRHLVGLVHAGGKEDQFANQAGYWSAEGRLLSHDGKSRERGRRVHQGRRAVARGHGRARRSPLGARRRWSGATEPRDDGDDGKPDNDAGARLAAAPGSARSARRCATS